MSKLALPAAASAALLAVVLLAGCTTSTPAPSPTGSPSQPAAEEAPLTSTVRLTGQLTPFSDGDRRVLQFAGADGTLLAVRFSEGLAIPAGTATLVIAVPANLPAGDTEAAMFLSLASVSATTGDPLEVVALG